VPRWAIAAALFRGAGVTDRSSLPGPQDPDAMFLAYQGSPRELVLPGLVIRARVGAGPVAGDGSLGQYPIYQASFARAVVDNMTPSRSRAGRPRRRVGRDGIEGVRTVVALRDGEERPTRLCEEWSRWASGSDSSTTPSAQP
jgi:hypothetical protein